MVSQKKVRDGKKKTQPSTSLIMIHHRGLLVFAKKKGWVFSILTHINKDFFFFVFQVFGIFFCFWIGGARQGGKAKKGKEEKKKRSSSGRKVPRPPFLCVFASARPRGLKTLRPSLRGETGARAAKRHKTHSLSRGEREREEEEERIHRPRLNNLLVVFFSLSLSLSLSLFPSLYF